MARGTCRSKVTSNDIEIKAAEAAETEIVIDRTREEYRPVAFHSALLFFCVADMGTVNDMYQYSMPWFVQLFVKAIEDSEKTDVITDRLKILADFCNRHGTPNPLKTRTRTRGRTPPV